MKKSKNIAFIAINGVMRQILFPLGRICATHGALDLLDRSGTDASMLLDKHQIGDWGQISREDWSVNREAISNGARILSSYELGEGKERLWIITEADRSATTLLLPEEY